MGKEKLQGKKLVMFIKITRLRHALWGGVFVIFSIFGHGERVYGDVFFRVEELSNVRMVLTSAPAAPARYRLRLQPQSAATSEQQPLEKVANTTNFQLENATTPHSYDAFTPTYPIVIKRYYDEKGIVRKILARQRQQAVVWQKTEHIDRVKVYFYRNGSLQRIENIIPQIGTHTLNFDNLGRIRDQSLTWADAGERSWGKVLRRAGEAATHLGKLTLRRRYTYDPTSDRIMRVDDYKNSMLRLSWVASLPVATPKGEKYRINYINAARQLSYYEEIETQKTSPIGVRRYIQTYQSAGVLLAQREQYYRLGVLVSERRDGEWALSYDYDDKGRLRERKYATLGGNAFARYETYEYYPIKARLSPIVFKFSPATIGAEALSAPARVGETPNSQLRRLMGLGNINNLSLESYIFSLQAPSPLTTYSRIYGDVYQGDNIVEQYRLLRVQGIYPSKMTIRTSKMRTEQGQNAVITTLERYFLSTRTLVRLYHNNVLTEKRIYTVAGTILGDYRYRYDEAGRLYESIFTSFKQKSPQTIRYLYAGKGRLPPNVEKTAVVGVTGNWEYFGHAFFRYLAARQRKFATLSLKQLVDEFSAFRKDKITGEQAILLAPDPDNEFILGNILAYRNYITQSKLARVLMLDATESVAAYLTVNREKLSGNRERLVLRYYNGEPKFYYHTASGKANNVTVGERKAFLTEGSTPSNPQYKEQLVSEYTFDYAVTARTNDGNVEVAQEIPAQAGLRPFTDRSTGTDSYVLKATPPTLAAAQQLPTQAVQRTYSLTGGLKEETILQLGQPPRKETFTSNKEEYERDFTEKIIPFID